MEYSKPERKSLLIELLADGSALDADRDDAAMDLGEEFDDEDVLEALIAVARNQSEIDMILNSCGEAIGKIWIRSDRFSPDTYSKLAGVARYGIYLAIKSLKPEWVERYRLEKDDFSD